MKSTVITVLAVMAIVGFSISVKAEPAPLPPTAMVSAICNGDNTATVTIDGVKVETYEMYQYFEPKGVLQGSQQVKHDLARGRRFNFTFGGGYFAGLSKDMGKQYSGGAPFLGQNIDIDGNTNKDACFIITCPSVRSTAAAKK